MKKQLYIFAALLCTIAAAPAATVSVPNFSFENPEVPTSVPALPFFEAWQHTPKPDWYVEDPSEPQSQWANFAGVFPNPAEGQPGHIPNLHLKQGGYLFSVPSNGIFQELPATYDLAQSYTMSVGIVGSSSIPPQEGAVLIIGFYYRDGASQMVPISSTSITYNAANFPDTISLRDFSVTSPAARALDPWLGKNIGISITAAPVGDKSGGIWDVENVRVETGPVNASFETPPVPTTVPALPMMFAPGWTQTPKPDWYVENPEEPQSHWANLAGIFPNTAPNSAGHIENLDGNQAAYLFAVPSNGIFQTLPATYEPGVSYKLTAAFVGSATFPPQDGTTLQISFYYADGTNMVTVASTPVVYSAANFPDLTNMVDFSVATPLLAKDNVAIGKNIGISLITSIANAGGVWDIDHVRFSAEALRIRFEKIGTDLRITWESKTGSTYQLQTSQDLINWTDTGSTVAGTNSDISVNVPIPGAPGQSFYKLRLITSP